MLVEGAARTRRTVGLAIVLRQYQIHAAMVPTKRQYARRLWCSGKSLSSPSKVWCAEAEGSVLEAYCVARRPDGRA